MILYHGSNVEITDIDLAKCRPNKDFGQGFYLTTIKEQAQRMANRVAKIYGGNPIVSVFNFKLPNNELNTKLFDTPNEEWAKFVINNRNKRFANHNDLLSNHDNKYDLVIGPVADDDLALLFRQFSNGNITIDNLIKEMKFKKLTDQYSFHTTKAIKFLHKVGVEID